MSYPPARSLLYGLKPSSTRYTSTWHTCALLQIEAPVPINGNETGPGFSSRINSCPTHHASNSSDGLRQGRRGCKVSPLPVHIFSFLAESSRRYTLTYTPSLDRILPPPSQLFVKIKNTAAIPLRAAYLHGPYTLYVACYPSTYNPYKKHERVKEEGAPEFEPQLKAGGSWSAKLTVPEEVREDAHHTNPRGQDPGRSGRKSFTWVIEIASQVIFSTSAAVHYELLVGRDEKSVDLGFHGVIGSGQGAPARLEDHQHSRTRVTGQPRGVFSKAIRLSIDDTESLWNTPPFPEWEEHGDVKVQEGPQHGDKRDAEEKDDKKQRKQKKIHLVLLTHGLHSNLGADMLYMKESIDTAAKEAREASKKRRFEVRKQQIAEANEFGRDAVDQRSRSTPEVSATRSDHDDTDDDEEQVIVRGFNGNAVKTERGIQYLGKRFAKYVLSLTYPDQPYLPVKSSISQTITNTLTGSKPPSLDGTQPIHKHSSIVKDENYKDHDLPYKITSISFISHSLGGLIQTYAIAYIQKHSPEFFDLIQPVNFVALASPFLGLSNENPMYVKFALDFGLVGRTGQDLGLTWRAPTIAKSGWGAVIGGLTNESQKAQKEPDPGAKPLLRILPTGPAHVALKKFRNRTVYSNVVNDGIVPLRTSCLLFLDWRGLGRVDKARRENGLVGTMVGWGWAEMTGQNASASRKPLTWNDLFGDSGDEASRSGKNSPDLESAVPQADASQAFDFDQKAEPDENQFLNSPSSPTGEAGDPSMASGATLWSGLLNLFKPQAGKSPPKSPRKAQKIYRRGQTMHHGHNHDSDPEQSRGNSLDSGGSDEQSGRPKGIVRGSSLYTNNSENGDVEAPPRTTFFESAGDLLNPPLPSRDFILDPGARPRTIHHDRVYHPEDIPPPPTKRQRTLMKRSASRDGSQQSLVPKSPTDSQQSESSQSTLTPQPSVGPMKIEEKIARAYHKDLSWRKVLVRLEPDAHNNMIVRRMFANAYGWPVVKHLCDTHFAYTAAAQTRDDDEAPIERAKAAEQPVLPTGEEVKGQTDPPREDFEPGKGEVNELDRSRSTTDVPATAAQPLKTDGVHADLQKLHAHWKLREDIQQRPGRTDSEIRESRDDISELVSKVSASGETASAFSTPSNATNYSNMSSSKAALSRLARMDSARWSDRFFDGSDDEELEEEDPTLMAEIERARSRGELNRSNSNTSDVTALSAKIADVLTTSPSSTKLVSAKPDTDSQPLSLFGGLDSIPLTAEPAELEPMSHSSGGNTPKPPHESGGALNPGSLTAFSIGTGRLGLGLGEGLDEMMTTRDGGKPGGVAGQVALARGKGKGKEQNTDDGHS